MTSLHRFAILTCLACLGLLLAGALVTSTGSGLAVPDWPLSYGQWWPPLVGGVLFEHGHRMIAVCVAILTLALAIWTWISKTTKTLRSLSLLALGVLLLQALLGGITVLYGLPALISIAHASLAQGFFCLLVCLALLTSRTWPPKNLTPKLSERQATTLKILTSLIFLAIYAQMILGASLRHHALGVSPHLLGALGVTALIFLTFAWIGRYCLPEPFLKASTALVFANLLQLLLGAIAYAGSRGGFLYIASTAAHVLGGALMLATSLMLTLWSFKTLKSLSPLPWKT